MLVSVGVRYPFAFEIMHREARVPERGTLHHGSLPGGLDGAFWPPAVVSPTPERLGLPPGVGHQGELARSLVVAVVWNLEGPCWVRGPAPTARIRPAISG